MLREPQHERKILNEIKTPPFVLSIVEGLRQSFSAACKGLSRAKHVLSPSAALRINSVEEDGKANLERSPFGDE
jgi:hypothetical protein